MRIWNLRFRWSVETHSFIVAWGELSPTLEVIVALTCLPMFGETDAIKIILNETDGKKLEALNNAYSKSSNKSTYASWLEILRDLKGTQ